MSEIRFMVPGPAVPQLGGRVFTPPGGRPMMRKNPKTERYQRNVSKIAQCVAPREPWSGPLEVRILIEREPLKSWSFRKVTAALKGEIHPKTRPDCDNYSKAILDAMTGIIYDDDAQICRLLVVKRYAERARVIINVIQIEEEVQGTFAEMLRERPDA